MSNHRPATAVSVALSIVLIGSLAFRSLVATYLPPGFDEAYYFLYTRHLDWSYFDHPPLVALSVGWGIWLSNSVSPLTLRLGALLLFTASLGLLYKTGAWLFSRRAGWLACLIAALCPLFALAFGTLAAPDNALIFFWSAALYLSAREFFPCGWIGATVVPYRPTARLSLIGLCIGLCCLSKYHGALLGLSWLGFCGLNARPAFRSIWMGLGFGLWGLCLLPIVYWNSQHEWISFQFQLSDRFTQSPFQLSWTRFLGAIAQEIAFLFPSLGIPLWGVGLSAAFRSLILSQRARQQFQGSPLQESFVLWSALPVAIGFTLLGGLTHTYPAWPAPGLWSLCLLLGHRAAKYPLTQLRCWLGSSAAGIALLLLLALSHITWGTLQKPSRYVLWPPGWIAPAQDPSTALIDVQQLAQKLKGLSSVNQALADSEFVVTQEFWLSGYVAMALANFGGTVSALPVASFTQDPRGHAFWFNPADWLGKDALFVSLSDFSQAQSVGAIAPYFRSIIPLTSIILTRGDVPVKTVYLYQAKQLNCPYRYPY